MLQKISRFILFSVAIVGVIVLFAFAVDYRVRRWQIDRQLSDIEIFNGTIKSKDAVSKDIKYDCNPHSVGFGKKRRVVYDTCTRQVIYYSIDLSFGDIIDYGIRDANQTPPYNWKILQVGQAASVAKNYKNYIKASDTTILKRKAFLESYEYKNMVPNPPRVYNEIFIDQVISINSKKEQFRSIGRDDFAYFNRELQKLNGSLGETKQLNTIIILVPDFMNDFIFAVDEKWIGGNKNEVVIFVNLNKENNKVTRVQTLSWSKENGAIETALDNEIVNNQGLNINNAADIDKFLSATKNVLNDKFDRQSMKEYEYLVEEIKKKYGF
jgi:hypothetical protein